MLPWNIMNNNIFYYKIKLPINPGFTDKLITKIPSAVSYNAMHFYGNKLLFPCISFKEWFLLLMSHFIY